MSDEVKTEVLDVSEKARQLINASDEEREVILSDSTPFQETRILLETVKIVKSNITASNKNNEKFIELCNHAISTIEDSLKDENLTPEERKKNREAIFKIVEMADNSTKDTRSKTFMQTMSLLGLSALGLLAFILKNRKSK